jgi:hypothetical protein
VTAPLLHEAEKLRSFLDYINNRQNNIQFTIGTPTEDHLPSMDINIYSKEDGSLGHKSTKETKQQKPLPDCKNTPPSKTDTHIRKINIFTKLHLNPYGLGLKTALAFLLVLEQTVQISE